MAFAKLISFDRPLATAMVPGRARQIHTADELAKAAADAYQRGVEDTRGATDQQMVEFRTEMAELSEGVLKHLAGVEPAVSAQLREAMPGLALEIAKRLFAGYEPSPEIISRICEETIAQLLPERTGLELILCERDAALLEDLRPDWIGTYPDLVIRGDAALTSGDCLVKSRFGVTDARRKSKMEALAHSLTGA